MEGAELTPSRPARSVVLRTLAGVLAVFSSYILGSLVAARTPSHDSLDARVSILAVGDTGKLHRPLASLLEGQVAVGNDLATEDRHHPVDALLLLGDNFYMHGLLASQLVERIRLNLVYPYCHFVELEGPRSLEVSSACPSWARNHEPKPIFAVLGNHDRASAQSPALQRDAIPDFVSNWKLTTQLAANQEMDGGLSLILVDSEGYARNEANRALLVTALRAAKGPWRVIATHTPMAIGISGNVPIEADHSLEFQRWVRGAIEQAGVHVHLYLSGHHHTVQLLEGEGELGPDLHVVVGSGARYRSILAPHPRRRYQAERLGFARVDVVRAQAADRLVVSLFLSPTIPLASFGGPQLVERWSIGLFGAAARID